MLCEIAKEYERLRLLLSKVGKEYSLDCENNDSFKQMSSEAFMDEICDSMSDIENVISGFFNQRKVAENERD